MKKLLSLIALTLSLMMIFSVSTGLAENVPAATEYEDAFTQWKEDAPALNALLDYVEAVTDENSSDYIPEADRIAVFDMDGTLCAELYPTYLEYWLLERRIFCDPSYEPDEEMLEFGRMLRDHALDKSFPDGMDVLHGEHAARAYAGMTLTQFQDFVTNQLVRDVDGFEGMTVANSFYLPMIEVVEYLQDNGFKVYVVSGSDRYLCRIFIEGVLDVPYEQIIGMDVDIEATNEDGADGLKYVYTSEDNIIRTDRLLIKNLKMNKVKAIVKEIGRQPVLSFGNSSGDVSMHNYTIYNNQYRSAAFMLIADDGERDYGDAEKVQPLKEKWEESGYHVISMANDWNTIYGEDVVKTGEFHWLEEFADNGIHSDAAKIETGLANPWTEMTKEELEQVSGVPFGVPEGAEALVYRWLASEGLAEMQFTLDGDEFIARVQPAQLQEGELMNISGMYFDWEHEEEITVNGCCGTIGLAQTGSEDWVELCQWYDLAPGLMYSLSVYTSGDPDGLDLTAVAEQVYIPTQGDTEAEDAADVQYVMYLGTNGKDTNKPVYTQEEAKEKVRDILIKHFGGYTLQEAYGGWVGDDGVVYQEYTLVINLSGTTAEKVHAAADELIQAFNQSSVLIQANPTTTEFYSAR